MVSNRAPDWSNSYFVLFHFFQLSAFQSPFGLAFDNVLSTLFGEKLLCPWSTPNKQTNKILRLKCTSPAPRTRTLRADFLGSSSSGIERPEPLPLSTLSRSLLTFEVRFEKNFKFWIGFNAPIVEWTQPDTRNPCWDQSQSFTRPNHQHTWH